MADVIMDDSDGPQKQLVDWFNETLDANHVVCSTAIAKINEASLKPGFVSALCEVFADKELSAKLLEQVYICFKESIIPKWGKAVLHEEKEVTRRSLLSSWNNSHGKNYTSISMLVFITLVLKMLDDSTEIDRVYVALECLECLDLLLKDIDEKVVPIVLPAVFPHLLSIVSAPQIYDKALRGKALSIVYSFTSKLSSMSDEYRARTTNLMSPLIEQWMAEFAIIMKHPLQLKEPDDWSLRTEVLKCLNQFAQNFPASFEKELMYNYCTSAPLMQTSFSSLELYEQSTIKGDKDFDGTKRSLISYITELLGFFLKIAGSRRFVQIVANELEELAYQIFGFLQMTEQQVNSWSLDVNQYAAEEDDDNNSCRIRGIFILEEIVSSCGEAGVEAILNAGIRRFSESQEVKREGSKCWWRIREALVYGLASLSAKVATMEDPVLGSHKLRTLCEWVVTENFEKGVPDYQFLWARLFSSLFEFSSMIKQEVKHSCLCEAMEVICSDISPLVKFGACRAVSQLLPGAKLEIIQPDMIILISSLEELLSEHAFESKEMLHLVLKSLQAAIVSGGEAAVAERVLVISSKIFDLWASHVSDRLISEDAVEVLEAIKNAPGCMESLVSHILPCIEPILRVPKHHSDELVAGSLLVITMLLKNSPSDIMKSLYDACFDPIVKIILQCDDSNKIKNAAECLGAFVSGGREELLAWDAVPESTMESLVDAFERNLNLEHTGSFAAVKYVLLLILYLPAQMSQHIPDLANALVDQMKSCDITGLEILSFLADTLIEIQVQVTNADEESNLAMHRKQYLSNLVMIDSNYFKKLASDLTQAQREALEEAIR